MRSKIMTTIRQFMGSTSAVAMAALLAACGGGGGGGTSSSGQQAGSVAAAANGAGGGAAVAPAQGASGGAAASAPAAAASGAGGGGGVVANGACVGTAIAAPGSVLYAPSVPQPAVAGDVVGLNVQNTGSTESGAHIITTGQVFAAGQVLSTDALKATIVNTAAVTPVQMDVLSVWPDNSVKLASLAFSVPDVCANSQIQAMLSKTTASAAAPVSLAASAPSLSVTLNFSSGNYSGSTTIDLNARLQSSLISSPDYWLRGPLVTQARVDVPVPSGLPSTLHLTADVSVFSDGTSAVDMQFNDDLATIIPANGSVNPLAPLAPLVYTATVNLAGSAVTKQVSQSQYTSWHTTLNPNGFAALNVQHDIAQLKRSGAIMPYDLTTGVNNTVLQGYDQNILQSATFGLPLSTNGVTIYMPTTGGRGDIGVTTQYNTVWLLTQDPRAANVAMAQSDTAGAIPWNFKLSNGHWITQAEVTGSTIWAGYGASGANSGYAGIAYNQDTSVWTTDQGHQPNLSYVPYIMKAARWNYDRINAQAAYNLSNVWPDSLCVASTCDVILNGWGQVRSQAWGFREVQRAAFIAHPGTFEAGLFTQVVAHNWAYVQSQRAALSSKQGQLAGWYPGTYGDNTGSTTAEWQQDYLTSAITLAAVGGDTNAGLFLAWQKPWISGRFIGSGMNPHDGCTYNVIVANPANTSVYYNTWSSFEAATVAAGDSNGSGWTQSQGDYCRLARASISGALVLAPNDTALQQALTWLNGSDAPFIDQGSFRDDPTFNVVNY